ncbi:hypothetical protein Dgeo_3050 (plasmid) [Deinococcus geothermalis DSM 11300]|uniref:Uncharacterized protein n=1 Tax=Deinococcus geothermalis (strain DSM 11300 / CIP 105573 / AG-3a) TaxID=319795 RepID=A8ZRI2_DEIGD|nr:hypothetical protein [Deinococcus geothermalis]ABW35091.1 hypothetical protein Dgeo_3050 [Deinococcus geothermalis DSM 11300]
MPPQLVQGKLRPDLFNELLNGSLSTRVAYLRADLCPCSAERGLGNSDPKCPVCEGLGYTWEDVTPAITQTHTLTRDPLPGYEDRERLPNPGAEIVEIVDEHGTPWPLEDVTVMPDGRVRWTGEAPPQFTLYTVTTSSATLRAGVQSVMSRREYQVRGEYDVLDLSMTLDRRLSDGITLNPAWDCGEGDRFVLLDAWRRHAQRLKRGQSGPEGDATVYRNMRDLTVSSIEGGARRVWQPGEDYTFRDGRILWQPGRGPKPGQSYAVQGQANPEYYVFKALPQLRQQDGQELPRSILLKGFENAPNRRPAEPVAPPRR